MTKQTKIWALVAILACSALTALTSCSNDDNTTEQPQEYTGIPLIILDTDIGSSTGPTYTPSNKCI